RASEGEPGNHRRRQKDGQPEHGPADDKTARPRLSPTNSDHASAGLHLSRPSLTRTQVGAANRRLWLKVLRTFNHQTAHATSRDLAPARQAALRQSVIAGGELGSPGGTPRETRLPFLGG